MSGYHTQGKIRKVCECDPPPTMRERLRWWLDRAMHERNTFGAPSVETASHVEALWRWRNPSEEELAEEYRAQCAETEADELYAVAITR